MSRAEIEAVVTEYCNALVRHDAETALSLWANDIVVHVNGHNVLSGTFEGKERFQQTQRWIFLEHDAGIDVVEVHDLLVSDDHAVALVEERAHRAEAALRYRRVLIFHVRDKRIGELWSIAEDPYALDQFWE
jgi:ketosteroid isomerase-like protein